MSNLTKRQQDCLYYLTKGMTARMIAEILGISHRTVEHYVEAIKVKLGCRTRSDLISQAFKIEIIRTRLLEQE